MRDGIGGGMIGLSIRTYPFAEEDEGLEFE